MPLPATTTGRWRGPLKCRTEVLAGEHVTLPLWLLREVSQHGWLDEFDDRRAAYWTRGNPKAAQRAIDDAILCLARQMVRAGL